MGVEVLGAQEMNTKTLNIRNRDDQSTQQKGEMIPLDEGLAKICSLRDEKRLINKL